MAILITGAAGFIGSRLSRFLLDKGEIVCGVDNFITGSATKINDLSTDQKFRFWEMDITGPSFTKTFCEGEPVDMIYHLACPTGVPNIQRLAQQMLDACSGGTRNVLEVARRHRAKILFTSSSEVYGDPEVFPQREEYTGNVNTTGLRSPYEEGKRFSETLILTYVKKYHLSAKIVRLFNVYGPGMMSEDSRVVPQFIGQATANRPLTIYGDGSQRRTFCFISDIINGLERVVSLGEAGQIYNLGSDQEITISELAKLVIGLTDSSSRLLFVHQPIEDHKRRLPDLTKIRSLGWRPMIDLRTGLEKMIMRPSRLVSAQLELVAS